MKTVYQYIRLTLIESKPKTDVWDCRNVKSGYVLGIVKWCPQWRQYCFYPEKSTLYSKGCLDDISDFIKQLMATRT